MKIEATDRQVIFNAFPLLAGALKHWQRDTYRLDELLFEPGEEVWLEADDEAPTVLSESMAEKLNRETEADILGLLDPFTNATPGSKPAGTLIAEMQAPSFEDFTGRIGPAFGEFAIDMQWQDFAVISDCRRPILAQDNDYPQVQAAEERLKRAGLSKSSPVGYRADAAGLSSILGDLFWIARCNASAPYILVAPRGTSVVAWLCKYGNFHFDFFDAAEKTQIEKGLQRSSLDIEPDNMCYERFSEDGAMPGRKIEI